jgi:hypothetical protein
VMMKRMTKKARKRPPAPEVYVRRALVGILERTSSKNYDPLSAAAQQIRAEQERARPETEEELARRLQTRAFFEAQQCKACDRPMSLCICGRSGR